jgi:CelD/BcsL family acetyltransferase involved in cellulose biosynthesis
VYHTREYHQLSGFGQSGEPQAFVYEEEDRVFVWPYILSPIPEAAGHCDVSSVYGYPGPVSSPGPEFVARAWRELCDHWKQQGVVSAFTRFNPLLENHSILAHIPQAAEGVRAHGPTVSMDLTLPEEEQVRLYSKTLRQAIRKARKEGAITIQDESWSHSDDFLELYTETMIRLGSQQDYLVDRAWVERFRAALGDHAHLFVTKIEGNVAAAMIAIAYPPFLHFHLLGSREEYSRLSPSKVLLDDYRSWGTRQGYKLVHMGGGVGGNTDELYQFKRRFSPRILTFHTGRWILNQPRFDELKQEHSIRLAARGVDLAESAFFPPYRYRP